MNIAVPVNFFHRDLAVGTFIAAAPGGFNPAASVGLVCAGPAALLVEVERAVGLLSVGAIPVEECPGTEEIQGEAFVGLLADG